MATRSPQTKHGEPKPLLSPGAGDVPSLRVIGVRVSGLCPKPDAQNSGPQHSLPDDGGGE